MGGIFWLLFATVVIFLKFGAFIFSLVSFTAAMSAIGPEGDDGDIVVIYKRCKRKIMGGDPEKEENLVVQQQQHEAVTSDEPTTPDATLAIAGEEEKELERKMQKEAEIADLRSQLEAQRQELE